MRKLLMTMIAAVLMGSVAYAQGDKKECKCEEKKECKCECQDKKDRKHHDKKFDKKNFAQHRTDRMVKKYGLDEKQAAQLLELNTKYSGKIGPLGHRHKTDAETGATDQQPQEKKRPELTEEQKAYNTELQKIMTDEQFKKYRADKEKYGGRGHKHGPREPKRR